jgi:hypothetical protein
MWSTTGREVDLERFTPFEPADILYQFDGPRTFTVRDAEGELYLAHWADEVDDVSRFIVVPTLQRTVDALRNGNISVYESLDQARCWLCDVSSQGNLLRCLRAEFSDVPADALPGHGTMLLPALEPLLTVRALGGALEAGQIPGSVMLTCIARVQRSVKILCDNAVEKASHVVRPSTLVGRLSDLRVQRIAFSSFEVSFRIGGECGATALLSDEALILKEMGELLRLSLDWLTSASDNRLMSLHPDEVMVALLALKELTPCGNIEQFELSGALAGCPQKPVRLTKESRRRVNGAIRDQRQNGSESVVLEGWIRELDKDHLKCEIRDFESERSSRQVYFHEQWRDDVFRAFNDDLPVRVFGVASPDRKFVRADKIVVFVSSRRERTV